MPFIGCTTGTGLMVTAVVTLLLLPAQYFVPDLKLVPEPPEPKLLRLRHSHNVTHTITSYIPLDLPPLDLCFTVLLIILATGTYVCDYIRRKLEERQILKLKQCLQERTDQLRSMDERQEQLKTMIKMVDNATNEYNILLYLLNAQAPPGPHH